jgi:hypothetical protein
MTILRADSFTGHDLAINGVGYMLEENALQLTGMVPYTTESPDLGVERQSLSPELSDNKLDSLVWASNRSWHEGAGQKRHDQPEFSSPHRFLESVGIDITEKGQATLLPVTAKVLSLSNLDPTAPQKLTATDSHVWVAVTPGNLKRFAELTTAADQMSVSTATETAQGTYDLASDGTLVYIALGVDGTHRYGASTTVTREAFDATTGFTGSGDFVSHTIDTANKKEGVASYVQTSNRTVGVDAVSAKTLAGAPLNFSTIDQFKIWAANGDTTRNAGYFEYRLITSAGNYFKRVVAVPNDQTDAWYEDTANRPSGFTTVGSPSWATINSIEVRHQPTTNAESGVAMWDDLRSVVVSGAAHYCDWDARTLGWAKDRLYAAGISSGTTWRFYEVVSGAPTASIYIFPDGWEVTDIQELQGYVYIATRRGRRGAVYAYDGTNAPFVALPLPPGEQATALFPFLGAGLLVGARRMTAVSSGGIGVVYRAFPTASGHLNAERVTTIGSDDGKDYGVRTCTAYGDWAYYGNSYAGPTAAGLGIYIPETGGFARNLEGTVSKAVIDSVVFKGRRVFTLDGNGVWVEQATTLATGYVTSSLIDLNVAADKVWLTQESTFAPLVAGQTVAHAYSTDGGATFTGTVTDSTAADTRLRTYRGVKSQSVHVRTTLGTSGASPTLYSTGMGGWPAVKPFTTHKCVIRAYPDEQQRSGLAVDGQDRGYQTYAALLALRDAAMPVQFQPPEWGASGATVNVRVADVRRVGQWGVTGREQGGMVYVELKEVGS